MSYPTFLVSVVLVVFLVVGTWPAKLADGASGSTWAGRSGNRLSPAVLDP